jgi:hypothetical protein
LIDQFAVHRANHGSQAWLVVRHASLLQWLEQRVRTPKTRATFFLSFFVLSPSAETLMVGADVSGSVFLSKGNGLYRERPSFSMTENN